jgi:hypothetical protein
MKIPMEFLMTIAYAASSLGFESICDDSDCAISTWNFHGSSWMSMGILDMTGNPKQPQFGGRGPA